LAVVPLFEVCVAVTARATPEWQPEQLVFFDGVAYAVVANADISPTVANATVPSISRLFILTLQCRGRLIGAATLLHCLEDIFGKLHEPSVR
jgi:hypothetical protein